MTKKKCKNCYFFTAENNKDSRLKNSGYCRKLEKQKFVSDTCSKHKTEGQINLLFNQLKLF